jgi:hypothetical protein
LTQIFKFPNEKHDDIADCIAQWIYQLRNGAWKLIEQNKRKESNIEVQYDQLTNMPINSWQRIP